MLLLIFTVVADVVDDVGLLPDVSIGDGKYANMHFLLLYYVFKVVIVISLDTVVIYRITWNIYLFTYFHIVFLR